MDNYPPLRQREALLKFAKALGCRDNALRRDENGDWRISGSKGHIYAVPGTLTDGKTEGFQMFVLNWSANGWNRARKTLSEFASLTNDGDDEGALFMGRLPAGEEASVIRHWLGVAKKAEYSAEVLSRKREMALTARQKMAQKPASDGPRLSVEPSDPEMVSTD